MLRICLFFRLTCVLLTLKSALPAHDLYIIPSTFKVKSGNMLTVSFHNGDLFPESEVAPPLARLKEARISFKSGNNPLGKLHVSGKEVLGEAKVPEGGTLQAAVETIPNFIELKPDKFVDYLKEEGLHHVLEWRAAHNENSRPGRERYSKFAKALLQSSGGEDSYYQQALGFPIEIVLLANPYSLAVGAKLPIQVLLRGKPAAGLQLKAARAANGKSNTNIIGRTGADGRIDVPVDQAGKWRLHTLSMERCQDPKAADWESLWASLTFEIR